MQASLPRLLGRQKRQDQEAGLGRLQPQPAAERPPSNQRPGGGKASSLLRLLGPQLVRAPMPGGGGNGTDQVAASCGYESEGEAQQQHSGQQRSPGTAAQLDRRESQGPPQPAAGQWHAARRQQPAPLELHPCPLCGRRLPQRELQQHVDRELLVLEEAAAAEAVAAGGEDWDNWGPEAPGQAVGGATRAAGAGQGGSLPALGPRLVAPRPWPSGWQQQQVQSQPDWTHGQQPPPRQSTDDWRIPAKSYKHPRPQALTHHRPPAAPVLVLGGVPQVTAPTDRRRLLHVFDRHVVPLKRQRRKTQAFNHYSDGAGFWGGEVIGLDGAENAGIKWEGMGTSDY